MFDHLLAWPDSLPDPADPSLEVLEKAAVLIRLRRYVEAEALILGQIAASASSLRSWHWLFVFLCISQRRTQSAELAFSAFPVDFKRPEDRFLHAQFLVEGSQVNRLRALPADWWHDETAFPLLGVAHACYLILASELDEAECIVSLYPEAFCAELLRCSSMISALRRDEQQSAKLITAAAERYPHHVGIYAEAVKRLIDARSRDHTIPFFRQALNLHGEQPEFLESAAVLKLLQREPAQARRCHLLLNAYDSVRPLPHHSTGLINSYEQTGYVDWMPYLHPALLKEPVETSSVQHNLCMFLASLDPRHAEKHVRNHVSGLMELPHYSQFAGVKPAVRLPQKSVHSQTLKIAWLTGDLVHHPVSRFLLGFFHSSIGCLSHEHLLVNLKDHQSESVAERFVGIPRLEHVEVGRLSPVEKLAVIREHQPHVVVDLSGWTDGNFAAGFMARMAPVQVNYLGYFASTGIPAMDAWLGDSLLFPDPMEEWHQEAVIRLPRCFIAWQPSQALPESKALIPDPPKSIGIRFGSFNHNRKLSNETLRLWGQILQSVPGSNLVLKANHRGDDATQILLRRRMQRQGLDPERVVWLPIAASPEEHLQQYGQMDVALDCFPNGGCTTTCEALWMGVPVITLTGSSYVSRMSTAVLHGAGLPELCAVNQEHYLQLAIEQANNLHWLRHHRGHWRYALKTNPLGDAADLMRHLEGCFTDLYREAANASAVSA